jgi:hypothetical protein
MPLTPGSRRSAAAPEHPDEYKLWPDSMPPRTRIEIGIVNNMPDAALVPTERQFSGLIEQASGDLDINISLYTLESLPVSRAHCRRSAKPIAPRENCALILPTR